MAEQDVLYHELLAALKPGGCPLCWLAARASESYLNALLHEGVTDVAIRQTLRDSRGFCRGHARVLSHKRGAVLGTAIVYRDVINTLTRELEVGAASPTRLFGRRDADLARRLGPSGDCPACVMEADAAARGARTLLQHVGTEEVGGGLVGAGGLCLPHLKLALGLAGDDETRSLAARQVEAWRELRGDLDELIRKHDHRFRHEPVSPSESASWRKALAASAGALGETLD
jgi:hypothetical protein